MLETSPRELTQNPLRKIWMPCRNGHIAQRRGKMQLDRQAPQRMMTGRWCGASIEICQIFFFIIDTFFLRLAHVDVSLFDIYARLFEMFRTNKVWPSSSFCASWQCCIMLSFFTPSRCTEVDLNRACEDNCKLASGEFEHMTNAWHKLHQFAKDHSSEANMSGDVRQFLSVWFALCRLACFCWVKLLFFSLFFGQAAVSSIFCA